jgi:hypothetical protein
MVPVPLLEPLPSPVPEVPEFEEFELEPFEPLEPLEPFPSPSVITLASLTLTFPYGPSS